MAGGQSTTRIVYAEVDVKSWSARLPSADEVRPPSCPCCGAASRPAGGRVVLHGHGLRTRDQWSPPDATAPPEVGGVVCRRYHCLACGAVILVAPRAVLRRRVYSAGAVALALALWGLDGLSAGAVRQRVSPWGLVGATAAGGWASLRRWARAVRSAALFASVRAVATGLSLRKVAAHAAAALAARAPSSSETLPLCARAFVGASM